MTPSQRAALLVLAAGAFWLGRAEADCAILNYSVQMNLVATTPADGSWPDTVELTQLSDHTITWRAAMGEDATVDLRAAQ